MLNSLPGPQTDLLARGPCLPASRLHNSPTVDFVSIHGFPSHAESRFSVLIKVIVFVVSDELDKL
jgi:hypothetical protein